MSDLSDNLQKALDSAVRNVFRNVEGAITTNWLVLAETVDGTGERGLWTFANPEAHANDTLGLMQWAQTRETAKVVAEHLRED